MMMRVCSRFAFALRRGGAYLPAPSSSLSILQLGRRSFSEVPTMLMNEVPTMGPEHEDRGSHSVEQALSVIASRGGSSETMTHYIKVFSRRGRVDKIQKLMDSVSKASAVSNGSPSGAPVLTLTLNHYHFNTAMASYVANNRAQLALDTFADMEQRWGVVPDEYSFGSAMLAYAALGRWEDALALFERLKASNWTIKPAVYLALIKCLGAAGKAEEALRLFSEMGDVGRISVERTIFHILRSAGRWREAAEILDRASPGMASLKSKKIMLDALQSRGQGELFLEFQLKWADSLRNNEAMVGRKVNRDEIDPSKAPLPTDTDTSNEMRAILKEATRTRDYREAVRVADAYVASGRRWNDAVLCMCFKAYGLALLPDRVQSLIENMDRRGAPMNIFHCNAALTAFNRCERSETTLSLFDLMPQRWTVKRDEISYGCAFIAYGRLGRWEDALSLYKTLDDVGIKRTDSLISASVITSLGNAGQWQQAYSLFGDLNPEGSVSSFAKAAILSTLRKAGQLQLVESLRLEFETHESQNGHKSSSIGPGFCNFHEIRRKARISGDYSTALSHLEVYPQKHTLSRGMVTECIGIFGDAQSPARLLAFIQQLEARGTLMNVYHCNAAMAAFNRCGRKYAKHALSLFQTMEQKWAVKRDEFSYGAAMQSHYVLGDSEQCVRLLNEAKEQGLPTNEVMFTVAIKAQSKAGKWQEAVSLFRDMGDMANEHAKQSLLRAMRGRAPAAVVETFENQFRAEKVGVSKEEEKRMFF